MTSQDERLRTIGGRYRLVQLIGEGGMGTVWRARDALLGRDVAVKEVRFPQGLSQQQQREVRERTLREARATARLSHPNVVTTYDVVEADGRPWIVMELLPGGNLSNILRDDGPLAPQRVAELGLGLLAALEASHAQGVVHRDVKPSNVLITADHRTVLSDFGIATMAGDPTLTATGLLLGSPAYMSPERVRGKRPGPEADLWSLGATLYAAAEGRPPYDSDTALGTLTAVISDPVEPPTVEGPLREAILGLLRKDPLDRLSIDRARQLLTRAAAEDELDTVALSAPPAVLQPAGDTEVVPPAGPGPMVAAPAHYAEPGATYGGDANQRTRAALVVGALVVLALLTIGAWGFTRGAGDPDPKPKAHRSAQARASTSQPASHSPSTISRPSQSTSAAGNAGSSPSASSGPTTQGSSGVDAPAGFTRYRDGSGFAVAVPEGWTPSSVGARVRFDDPGGSRYLLVDQTDQPKDDPMRDWRQQEKSVRARLPNYQRIRIEQVDYRNWPAADWEFTFGEHTHVLDRGFVTHGKGYAIYLSTPESQWQDSQGIFQTAADTFRPAR